MEKQKPNVVMIMTNDQGYGDMGCHGNPVACTPHLDSLHDENVLLTDFHVAPTRGQFLAGLDAARNGAVNVSCCRALLHPGYSTLADLFRKERCRMGHFGNGISETPILIGPKIDDLRNSSGFPPSRSWRTMKFSS